MHLWKEEEFTKAVNIKDNYATDWNEINEYFGIYTDWGFNTNSLYGQQDRDQVARNRTSFSKEPSNYIWQASSLLSSFVFPSVENSINVESIREFDDQEVNTFFKKAGNLIQKTLSNPSLAFSSTLTLAINQLLLYGCTALLVTGDVLNPNISCVSLKEIFFSVDDDGEINRIWRQYTGATTGETFLESYKKTGDFVSPFNSDEFPIEYVRCNQKGDVVKSEKLAYWPITISAIKRQPGFSYGAGMGIEMLPHVKRLNAIQRSHLNAAQLQAQPALQVNQSMVLGRLEGEGDDGKDWIVPFGSRRPVEQHVLRPSQIVRTTEPGQAITPILQSIDLNQLTATAAQDLEAIRKFSLIDILSLADIGGNATAMEVAERVTLKHSMLQPVVAPLQQLLDGIVKRLLFSLMFDKKVMEKFGIEEITNEDLLPVKIQYKTRFSALADKREALMLETLYQTIGQSASLDPTTIANIDMDNLLRLSTRLYGFSHLLKDTMEVEDTKAQMKQQAQQTQGG